MIEINRPMIDWLTLTTFNSRLASEIADKAAAANVVGKWAPEKRMQYEGVVRAGAFIGSAIQTGREHFMFQASGSAAHNWTYLWDIRAGARCTRVDLQITIDCPEQYGARDYYDKLVRANETGRTRSLSIVQSGDGLDTVYIGSRTSEQFARLYIKPSGDSRLLRYEIEYKGEKAKYAYARCLADHTLIGAYLRHELDKLPEDVTIQMLRLACGDQSEAVPAQKRESGNKTIRWMRKAVTPAVVRMLNDHDEHYGMKQIVHEWAALLDSSGSTH